MSKSALPKILTEKRNNFMPVRSHKILGQIPPKKRIVAQKQRSNRIRGDSESRSHQLAHCTKHSGSCEGMCEVCNSALVDSGG